MPAAKGHSKKLNTAVYRQFRTWAFIKIYVSFQQPQTCLRGGVDPRGGGGGSLYDSFWADPTWTKAELNGDFAHVVQ